MIKPVTKEKIVALLRQQVEFDPEPAINQLYKGNPVPVCELFCTIMDDMTKRCNNLKAYSGKIAEAMDDLRKEVGA